MKNLNNAKASNEKQIGEEGLSSKTLVFFVVWLGVTIIICSLLDYFFKGIIIGPLIPVIDQTFTISLILYYISILTVAFYIGIIGLRELIMERRFSVEFLMAVAGLGALLLGRFIESATVLLLYCVAEYLEDYIQDRARRTVEKLGKFLPDRAHVIIEGKEKDVFVTAVEHGVILLVRPGERIPLDGTIIEGFSHVDQALVTGESIPVPKKVYDNVYGGTFNTDGLLKISVTKKASEGLVSRIVELVIESSRKKASIEKLIDRFAKVYVPTVIALAIFTAVVVPLITNGNFSEWFYRSLILLVVSCPSAFIISVPATVLMAVTVSAKRGVIIKGGIYIEKLARVKKVIFDKTGTLTLGRPTVHEFRQVKINKTKTEALAYAAALDQYSNHPIAQAIVRKALENEIDLSKIHVSDVLEVPGKGIIGIVNGKHVAIGNIELMREFGCDCTEAFEIISEDIHTAVCVSVSKEGLAAVCVEDEVREDALKAVHSLKKSGITTAMLTGDKKEIANETARTLSVDEVYAELLPEDKLRIVEKMKGKDGLIIMVGDGVNDAPALAASDVGIAMGGKKVDVALESADIVLVNDELAQIPYLIKLSEKTMGIAKQNIASSLVVKIILGVLGFFGLVPLLFTVAAGDDGVTLLLLLNSLRLERVK